MTRYNPNPQTLEECVSAIEEANKVITKYPSFTTELAKGELNLGMFWDLMSSAQALNNAYTQIDKLWARAREAATTESKGKEQ